MKRNCQVSSGDERAYLVWSLMDNEEWAEGYVGPFVWSTQRSRPPESVRDSSST